MPDAVIVFNAGSSSVKLALFEVAGGGAPCCIARGMLEGIGESPRLSVHAPDGAVLTERRWDAGGALSHEALLPDVIDAAERAVGGDRLRAAGHRIVHGGMDFSDPVVVEGDVLARIEALTPLAPLHQPHGIAPIRATARARPGLPQVACFDTAFHRTMPDLARRFALPRALHDSGVRRYGFHGLSYEFIAGRMAALSPRAARGRMLVAHLGNGASLCAMRDGRSVETTMGMTALDGLVMGTRSGALDPGVILYLMQQRGMDARAVEDLLYHRSGLLGVSGIASDMRALQSSEAPEAREAVALFAYRFGQEAAAMAAATQGLDAVVFTGGIGEHAAGVRSACCARLAWLGVALDDGANARGEGRVSTQVSAVEVWVVPTDEEAVIARHTLARVAGK